MSRLSLPDRPIRITKAGRPAYWGMIFGSFILIALGAVVGYWQIPSLQHDWIISRNPVLVHDGDVENGECTTRKGIFVDCSAHLSYIVDGKRYETDTSLMFVDFHSGDYEVDVVRSGDNPALASMSIGIDKLWNRAIFFLIILGLTLGIGLFLLAMALGVKRAAGLMALPGRVDLREVAVRDVQSARRLDRITFQDPKDARPKDKVVSAFCKANQPLIWAATDGTTMALAVKHQAPRIPVLLDAGLMRLDLTKAERQAALVSMQMAAA